MAFALPILHQLLKDPFGVYALILTPTRELAFQIADQIKAVSVGANVRIVVCVGGVDMMKQAIELNNRPHIIVATPGRLRDHIRSNSDVLYFKKLKFLVICFY